MTRPVRARSHSRLRPKAALGPLALAGAVAAFPILLSLPASANATPASFNDFVGHIGPAVMRITANQVLPIHEPLEGPPFSADDLPHGSFAMTVDDATLSPHRGGSVVRSLGMSLAQLDDNARARWGLADDARGTIVTAVSENTAAGEDSVKPGDLILRVNHILVVGPEDIVTAVQHAKNANRKSVLLLIDRQGEQRFVPMRIAGA